VDAREAREGGRRGAGRRAQSRERGDQEGELADQAQAEQGHQLARGLVRGGAGHQAKGRKGKAGDHCSLGKGEEGSRKGAQGGTARNQEDN